MEMLPFRAPPTFGETVYETVPFPVPLPPPVTVTQLRLSTACHSQPSWIVTDTLNEPPSTGTDWLVGLSVAEQRSCVTVKVRPAIVIVPVRDDPPKSSTLYVTLPFPV